ncbi:hypothetical protein ACP70R_047645 [Stipagrostis hirtigluma subsp. patula]
MALALRLSNNVIGALNMAAFLLSVPVLGAGVWLRTRADGTGCDHFLSTPAVALGAVLMAVSLAGLLGACCRVTWLLWLYLLAMSVLIVALLCFTLLAFAVTGRGAGYNEHRLGDHSTWLRRHVESGGNWAGIRSCLAGADVCGALQGRNASSSPARFFRGDLPAVQSGCCEPPAGCNFTHAGGAAWDKAAAGGVKPAEDPDCDAWSSDADELCYGCQACKAVVVDALRRDWKRAAIVNVVVLAFVVVVYSVGCCAYRNSRRDNHAYRRSVEWKQGGYA